MRQVIRGLGRSITERSIQHHSGSEGPRYDPYAYDEWTVTINGQEVVLHEGLGVTLTVVHGKDRRPSYKQRVVERMQETMDKQSLPALYARFEELTGIARDDLEKLYERVHPYFDDPMGSPSSYE